MNSIHKMIIWITGKFEIDFANVLILMFFFGFAFELCMIFDVLIYQDNTFGEEKAP